jgi:PAS domain S-box-containing protein
MVYAELGAASRVITNLRARLLAAFALVLLIVVAESAVTYITIQQDRAATDWVHHTDQVLAVATMAQDSITDMELRYEEFLRTGDDSAASAYQQDANAYQPQLAALVELTSDNPPQVERWKTIGQETDQLRAQIVEPGIAVRREINSGQASPDALLSVDPSGTGEQAFSRISSTFDAAITTERTLLTERANVADQADADLQHLLFWGTALTVVLGLGIAAWMAARIGHAMDRFATVAQSIAGGNLSQRIQLQRSDEIGRAAAAFDHMADALEADRAERMRAQAQAESLRRQTDSILSSAAEGIYGQDPDGICVLVNPAVSRMSGFSMDELSGARIHDLLHHSHADCSPYPLEACPILGVQMSGEPIHSVEDVFWRKDGSCFPVEFTAVPIHENDAITGVVVTFHDITERRAIDRMKNEFISIVSHELRTPLTSIRGSLGLVGSGLLGPVPGRASHMVKMAISNADRLIRLINDVLDIERIESGRATLDVRPIELADVVRQAIDSIAAAAESAQVTLTTDVQALTVEADADRVQQTLVNLIGNAIKFSDPGSTVTVSAGATGAEAVISVRDTGRGIPPEKLGKIFERFEQVDASDARQKGGSGLGLAISRSIVHQHGGRIWVDSTLGEGSTFSFTLPLLSSESPLRRRAPAR